MKLKKINHQLYKFSTEAIQTPFMKLLFTPSVLYNNIILKMEFTNLNTNLQLQQCLESISNLEIEIFNEVSKISNKDLTLKSQIIQNKQYNPYLLAKVISKKTKFNFETQIHSSIYQNILTIPSSTLLKLNIYCDTVWITNQNQVIIKWKIKDLYS